MDRVNCLRRGIFAAAMVCALALSARADVGGVVYHELPINGATQNTYGVHDVNEPGIGGVTVTVIGTQGSGTTTTASDGSWSIAGTLGDVRVEFSNLPDGLMTAPAHAPVRFAADGDMNINVGVIDPVSYLASTDNPRMIAPIYVNGDAQASGSSAASQNVLFAVPFRNDVAQTPLATAADIGAVWGNAYHPQSDTLFLAALTKRHAAYGPLGPSGIYVVRNAKTALPAVQQFVDLSAVNAAFDAGSTAHDFSPGGGIKTQGNHDAAIFGRVATEGLGGIDISSDGRYLYVQNLKDRTLWRVEVTRDAVAPTQSSQVVAYAPYPNPCTVGTFRPFAVTVHAGNIFAGGTCDGTTDLNNPAAAVDRSDLRAVIYAVAESADPATATWQEVARFPLTYNREANINVGGGFPKSTRYTDASTSDQSLSIAAWHPWSNDGDRNNTSIFYRSIISWGNDVPSVAYPQPILSGIAFDGEDMILSLMDRTGLMFGHANLPPDPSASWIIDTTSVAGDLLRASFDGTTYVLENNGAVGTRVSAGAGNSQGPGGGEFYFHDAFDIGNGGTADAFFANCTPGSCNHEEVTVGGLALLPGGDVVVPSYDPLKEFFTTGLRWYSNEDGTVTDAMQMYNYRDPGMFGKSHGIGDVEILMDAPPMEIGNRIWFDGGSGIAGADGNGIQDPGEGGIADVVVVLQCGALTAETTTAADGTYYFRDYYQDVAQWPGGIIPRDANDCSISVGVHQPPLSGLSVVAADRGTDDALDSDGVEDNGIVVVRIPDTGSGVQNIYTYDIGFGVPGVSVGDYVWEDTNANGTQDAGEPPIAGATVELFATTDGGATLTPAVHVNGDAVTPQTTASDGSYRFDALPDGDYVVRITPPAGYSPSPVQVADANSADNTDSNIDVARNTQTGSYESGVVALAVGAEVLDGDANDNHNPSLDFGFVKTLSIGDYVWEDTNANGTQDAGEPPIAGVVLSLLKDDGTGTFVPATDAFGAVVSQQTTDEQGRYRFTGLGAGTYIVVVDASNWSSGVFALGAPYAGYRGTLGVGADDANNADDNGDNDGVRAPTNGVRSGPIVLAPGSESTADGDADPNSDLTVDFGFYGYALGNLVWFDNDNSGAKGATESGLANITLTLLDTAGNPIDADSATPGVQPMTTVTDAQGYYVFDNIPAGEYRVRVDASNFAQGATLASYTASTGVAREVDPNADGNDNANGLIAGDAGYPGNAAANGIVTGTVAIGNGEPTGEAVQNSALPDAVNNLTVDIGIINPAVSVGNFIWEDADRDGTQDAGEPPIAGATVELFATTDGGATLTPATDLAGSAVAAQVTDAQGHYAFTNLPPGDYIVRVTLPNGYVPTLVQNSDPNVTDDTDSNFDLLRTAPVGTYESGLISLSVGSESGDGDVDDNNNQSIDFGAILDPSIGNRVWNDHDADGVQDAGEEGIAGVTLSLFVDDGTGTFVPATHIDGTPVAAQTTDALGHYNFGTLPDGTYRVRVDASNWDAGGIFAAGGAYAGFVPSPGDGGDNGDNTDDNGDSDGVTPTNGVWSQPIALAAGTEPVSEDDQETVPNSNSDLTVDFGFYGYALGNHVWFDADNSGHINNGERGIAGVTVELLRADGSAIDSDTLTPGIQPTTTVTDAQGQYLFTGLAAGDYIVQIVASNFAGGNVLYAHYPSFGSYEEDDPNDNGDENDNGLDRGDAAYPGEPDVAGVRSGVVTLGDGEPISESPYNAPTTLADDRGNLTVDFGFFTAVSLGDYVWHDVNVDGRQAGEDPISGVTLDLFATTDGGATLTPAVDVTGANVPRAITDANGRYAFDNLPPGDYIVRVTRPGGTSWLATLTNTPTPNTTDNTDSNFDLMRSTPSDTWESGVISLSVGDETGDGDTDDDRNPSVDFGLFKPMSVGNRVWLDANRNGVYDSGEVPVGGVVLALEMDDGTGTFVPAVDVNGDTVPQQTTDADGYYMFTRLNPGTYRVRVVAENWRSGPFGAQQTLSDARGTISGGGDDNVNNDNNGDNQDVPQPSQGLVSAAITLTPGAEPTTEDAKEIIADPNSDLTIDFGVYTPVGIGNYVWLDADADGVQDADEAGIAGVRVVLEMDDGTGIFVPAVDTQGTAIAPQFTDASGHYFFDNLRPGTYRAHITADNWTGGVFAAGELTDARGTIGGGGDNAVQADDNGDNDHVATPSDGIRSTPVVLRSQSEPTLEDAREPGADADTDLTIDFGVYTPVGIGNYVWLDADADGVQDADEAGIAGVTVELLHADGSAAIYSDGTAVAPVVTDARGRYRFDGLLPGDYRVRIAASNWDAGGVFAAGGAYAGARGTIGGDGDNGDNADDMDDNGDADRRHAPGVITSEVIALRSQGESRDDGDADADTDLTIDFGFFAPVRIGDTVWEDTDVDGVQDADEAGIAGVRVVLERKDGDVYTSDIIDVDHAAVTTEAVTDAQGRYNFGNLFPGTYRVRVLRENWNEGAVFGKGGELVAAFGTTGNGGDTPNNTDDNGDADFIVAPDGGVVSDDIVLRSFAETGDGDADANSNPSVDFGFARGLVLGNRIWHDEDGDGVQDDDELGIDGVIVRLYSVRDDGTYAQRGEVVTHDGGYYRFEKLPPGRYIIVLPRENFTEGAALDDMRSSGVQHDGEEDTAPRVDDDPADRDDNGMWDTMDAFDDSVTSSVVTLHPVPGEPLGETDICSACAPIAVPDMMTNLTVDFGFYRPAQLGNRVWLDANRNGVQDSHEQSVVGVKVKLYDHSGKKIATTKTNKRGRYRFRNLPPGIYRVKFVLPDGYVFTSRHGASNTGDDSDARTRSGKTQHVTLRSGDNYRRLDAGIYKPQLAQTGDTRVAIGAALFGGGLLLIIGSVLRGLMRRRKAVR